MDKSSTLSLEEQLKQGLILPGNPIPFRQTIEMQFQEGVIDGLKEQNKKILLTESTDPKKQGKNLLVMVEGIHTGMTKNLTFYPGTALEASVPTWTTPHKKPVIKNHDISAEPLGRIEESTYVESTLVDKYTVRLKLNITDEDAITKILDGRYLTLSVGGSANRVNCSICGKDLVVEGWCGHSRGRTYEGKQAYWTIGDYTGDEISFVNMPADVFSQVIAAELVTGKGGTDVGNAKPKEAEGEAQTGIKTVESEVGLIDNLLGDNQTGIQTGEGAKPEGTEPEGNEPNPAKPTEGNEPANPTETLEEQVTRLTQELSEMTTSRDNALVENTNLTAEKDQAIADLAEMTKHKESAEGERDTFKEQNLKLAKFARRSMAERVVDLRILQGKENKEASREALVTEWVGSSSKVLESTIKDLVESSKRHIVTVPNPAVVENNNDPNVIPVNENDEEIEAPATPVAKPKLKTLKDLSEGMTSYLSRNFN